MPKKKENNNRKGDECGDRRGSWVGVVPDAPEGPPTPLPHRLDRKAADRCAKPKQKYTARRDRRRLTTRGSGMMRGAAAAQHFPLAGSNMAPRSSPLCQRSCP